jgi:hypothetical protein
MENFVFYITLKFLFNLNSIVTNVFIIFNNFKILNKLIENLNATLDASTQQKLKASIASLELTMSEFSKISKNAMSTN